MFVLGLNLLFDIPEMLTDEGGDGGLADGQFLLFYTRAVVEYDELPGSCLFVSVLRYNRLKLFQLIVKSKKLYYCTCSECSRGISITGKINGVN